ncbi:class I SAM-dependent methyltransferase [Dactylosporangium siamense]|uniref:SAM-dependent methyltransferase n=1 Tax=Dactylosporangium siamense TaxID=685454 RepID=A0A919PS18_9ACTN|nr:methyltransferase domain-containing protein [Dactylosporangium siamense]GIG49576.1 SAM-dependent methyltransferase [Dactylosporangium siamense]
MTETANLTERLLGQLLAGTELFSVHLGIQLGLYQVLHEHPDATDAVLAERAGIDRRYAREWLEQQAAAGYVLCTSLADRTFRLPDGAADVLLDPAHPASGVGMVTVFAGVAQAVPALAEAYRTGGGVPYAAYGSFTRDGIAAMNLPGFRHCLAQEWLPALPDVVERLTKAPARVMDLGCGAGASTLAIAAAFPRAAVTGVDLDEESIADARRAAAAAGLADRVTFLRQDAAATEGDYALVTIFEALHDMGDPVGVLRTVRGLLAPGGVLFVADEKVADEFTAPADEIERLQYAFSVLHCLPATMAEHPVEAAGTALRAPTVARWAAQAGFASTVLPIEHDFWRFYRLSVLD